MEKKSRERRAHRKNGQNRCRRGIFALHRNGRAEERARQERGDSWNHSLDAPSLVREQVRSSTWREEDNLRSPTIAWSGTCRPTRMLHTRAGHGASWRLRLRRAHEESSAPTNGTSHSDLRSLFPSNLVRVGSSETIPNVLWTEPAAVPKRA
eukprot:767440-Hanusia_phi.AAC.6